MAKKILLADDSITIQKVIELTFSDEDFDVVTVGNGRLAIEKAQELRPDVILCDIIMPERDGYEVCEFIKRHPALSHVPVLLLTGAFEPFDQDRAARVGCDGFLAKPFEPQTLIAKVKDLLNQAATRQSAAPAAPTRPFVSSPPSPPAAAAPPPAFAAPAPATFTEPAAEPAITYIPEEPVVENAAAATFADALDLGVEPEPAVADEALYPPGGGFPGAEELMQVTPEESATLSSAPAVEDSTATLAFQASPTGWAAPTMEVPLEARARAGVESVRAEGFEEVFEEETVAPAAVPGAPPVPPAPPPATPAASFVDLRAPEAPAPRPTSVAGEVSVPVEMVETIAQRVVAQISEKVVREIAWEVIPDLAEALIKKEIERLKAELQRT